MSRPYRQQSRLKEAERLSGIITARDISDAADSKPLGRFGAALVRRPVREGIAMAAAGPIARRGNQEAQDD